MRVYTEPDVSACMVNFIAPVAAVQSSIPQRHGRVEQEPSFFFLSAVTLRTYSYSYVLIRIRRFLVQNLLILLTNDVSHFYGQNHGI